MNELVWNLNGKYFKDFGVFISSSNGILDEPAQKSGNSVNWSEYNGLAVDVSRKPKYESKEFELSGWVVGKDWEEMLSRFNAIVGEFRKQGKQRLTLNVFGEKTLVFDVNLLGKVELKKTFRDSRMIGLFTLKLVEYNPIKKVLKIEDANLQLAFNTPKWVEVNIDGNIESLKGSVSIDKPLTVRKLSNYNYGGRNTLKRSTAIDTDGVLTRLGADFNIIGKSSGNSKLRLKNVINTDGEWTISGFVKNNFGENLSFKIADFSSPYQSFSFVGDKKEHYFEFTFNVQGATSSLNFIEIVDVLNSEYIFSKIKIEKGNKATDWTPAPEDVHFISIAGNVEEITNLTTNANVLWERL